MRDFNALQQRDIRDAEILARQISAPLHHCVDTTQCTSPTECPMCMNAGRLAVQNYRKVIERRVVDHLVREYDAGCQFPHGSD